MTASDACALLRLQLRPKRPMVRVCRQEEALLVCDVSVRPETLSALGWTARRQGGCLLADFPDPVYQALAFRLPMPATDVWVEAWADCQALLSDLARRNGPWRGAASVSLLREAMRAFSAGSNPIAADVAARAFLFRLRAEAAVTLRSGDDQGVYAAARVGAHWLYRTHGIGLPRAPVAVPAWSRISDKGPERSSDVGIQGSEKNAVPSPVPYGFCPVTMVLNPPCHS